MAGGAGTGAAGTTGSAGTGGAAGSGGTTATEAGPQCGNRQVGPLEHCVVPGIGCQDCGLTEFAVCVQADGSSWPCWNLQGAALVACETLVECVIKMYQRSMFLEGCGYVMSNQCTRSGFSGPPCYCSDQTCSTGGDRECAPAFEAVAGSNDSAEVLRQLADPTTTLSRVQSWLEYAYCDLHCQPRIYTPLIPQRGSHHGGLSFIVNEINHVQEGSDPGEFIEIFNGTGGPVDFAGKDLVGFEGRKRVLTVPLDGVVPNGGYLVVGAAAVSVPAGVKKIDLPPGTNLIPDTSGFVVMFLPTGAPDPSPIPDDIDILDQANPDAPFGGSQEGSACLIPNGVDSLDWRAPIVHCAKATPGALNVQ